jgi:mono/diheme cytochrome c family protein
MMIVDGLLQLAVAPMFLRTVILCLVVLSSAPARSAESGRVDFDRDVRPILSEHCANCHGPDEKKRKAGLRFDLPTERLTAEEARARADILGAGKPEQSEFVRRLFTEDADDVMPPPDAGLNLTDTQRQILRRWVAEGARFSDHWSFVAPVAAELPPVKNPAWCRSEIDHFVLARMESTGLSPSPEADRATLIRRLSFSLAGLPPSPAEVAAFVNDDSATAYETLIARLLQSERFGERMAVDWLDAARYADTSGYQYDWPRTMWRWRDWVIDAFNKSLPYNAFIEWQLAGDLLPGSQSFHAVATGFNRNHGFTIESGTIDEEYRTQYVNDRVTTMGAAMLGLTLDCARCHDHKYDPVTQRDFYSLFAFFNQMNEAGVVPGRLQFGRPAISTPSASQLQDEARILAEVAALEERLGMEDAEADRAQADWETKYESIWRPFRDLDLGVIPSSSSSESTPVRSLDIQARVMADVWIAGGPVAARSVSGFRIRLRFDAPSAALFDTALIRKVDLWRKPAGEDKLELSVIRAGSTLPDSESARVVVDPNASASLDLPMNEWVAVTLELAKPLELVEGENLIMRLEVGSHRPATFRHSVDFATTDRPVRLDRTGGLDDALNVALADRNDNARELARRTFRAQHHAPYREVRSRIESLEEELRKLRDAVPMTMIMRDDRDRETFVLERGAYDKQLEKVTPDTPAFLPSMPADAPRNRLGLAKWLTAPENPLTARVAVNRVWRQMFGLGLVRTPEDFGLQGEAPTHPELLDWLAVDFVRNGWNVKRLILQICLSATWRQASNLGAGEDPDPEHRLLTRYPRRRLSAEMLRDNALAIGGLLTEQVGGPSVKPYQPEGLWSELTNREDYRQNYTRDSGAALYRRGLYVYWKRASHHPVMALFDAPSRETCSLRRPTTNTPLQALALLNETAFVESARALAGRMLTDLGFGRNDEQRIDHAFLTAASRPPEKLERSALLNLLKEERIGFAKDSDAVTRISEIGDAKNPAGVDPVELAAFTSVARAILNMSDTISLP